MCMQCGQSSDESLNVELEVVHNRRVRNEKIVTERFSSVLRRTLSTVQRAGTVGQTFGFDKRGVRTRARQDFSFVLSVNTGGEKTTNP